MPPPDLLLAGSVLRAGRHVELVALGPMNYRVLHEALSVPEVADTWRPRGRTIASYDWERFLLHGLYLGAGVRRADDGAVVGLVELRDHEPTDQYAYLSAAATPANLGSGLMVEAIILLLDEAFARGLLRKVYMFLSEDSRCRAACALHSVLTTEAVLRGHVVLKGRRQDVTVASVTIDEFAQRLDARPELVALSPDWRSCSPRRRPADDAVRELLANLTGCSAGELHHDLPIAEATALDSFAMLEVLAVLEDVAGHPVDAGVLCSMSTVGDLLGWVAALR